MIEYLVPFVTGITSWGYIKLDGNIIASPLPNLYFNSLSKNANSPPSKFSFKYVIDVKVVFSDALSR